MKRRKRNPILMKTAEKKKRERDRKKSKMKKAVQRK